MADPEGYEPQYDFSNYQSTNPSRPLPGHELDVELHNISEAIGQTNDALGDIRRSDGKLQNKSVTADSLADDILDMVTEGAITSANASAAAAAASALASAASATAAGDAAAVSTEAADDAEGFSTAASASAATATAAAALASAGSPLRVRTFSELASRLRYSGATGAQLNVAADDIVDVPGWGAFTVRASGATGVDLDYTGTGGVKLNRVSATLQPKAGESIQIIGNGDNGTPLTLKSGVMYFNGTTNVPDVPITGLFNIMDENGVIHMSVWPDLSGDGDYDADFWFKGNGYLAATASFQMRFGDNDELDGAGFGERGRIRFGCTGNEAGAGTTNVNFIQSGVNFNGPPYTINDFGIGPFNSSDWWTFWESSTGHMAIGHNAPRARLHPQVAATDVAVFESTVATARIGFRASSQTDDTTATIGVDSAGRLVGRGAGVDIFKLGATGMQAAADNTLTCGTGSFRWSVVFAGTGTINTSDEREKQDIGAIPDEWLDAWETVEWSRYKWRDAVAEKGDDARWHLGLIAQRVAAAFEARGIDPFSIGIVCRDEWEDEETGQKRDRYGLRYDQAFALEAAYQRRRAERMEARLAALEAKLA